MTKVLLQPLQNRFEQHRQYLIEKYGAENVQEQEMQQNMEGEQTQQTQQQQTTTQQQQQQQTPADPLATIDMDLLDPNTAQAVTAARAELTRLTQLANQASTHQSRVDQLQSELQRLQNQQPNNQQQQQQQRQQDQQPTFEEELVQSYIDGGVPEAAARQMAKVQAPAFERFAARTQKFVQSTVAPVAGSVALQTATGIFEDLVAASDVSEALSNPELAQEVWGKISKAVEQGVEITPELAENMVIIAAHKAARNGNQQQQQQPQQFQTRQPMHQQQQQQQTTTRFSYPGAGHRAAAPTMVTRGARPTMDSDTAAAVAMTADLMKRYGTNAPQALPKITRG